MYFFKKHLSGWGDGLVGRYPEAIAVVCIAELRLPCHWDAWAQLACSSGEAERSPQNGGLLWGLGPNAMVPSLLCTWAPLAYGWELGNRVRGGPAFPWSIHALDKKGKTETRKGRTSLIPSEL